MNSKQLFIKWCLASGLGWSAGLAVGWVLTLVGGRFFSLNEDRVFLPITLISLGMTTGIAQWLVLRCWFPQAGLWIPTTFLGFLACCLVSMGWNAFGLAGQDVGNNALLLASQGGLIGAMQWFLLRQHFRAAGLWVIASALGFLWFLGLIIRPAHAPVELILRASSMAILAALITGATLIWLRLQPVSLPTR